jgi:hypothetical protein
MNASEERIGPPAPIPPPRWPRREERREDAPPRRRPPRDRHGRPAPDDDGPHVDEYA